MVNQVLCFTDKAFKILLHDIGSGNFASELIKPTLNMYPETQNSELENSESCSNFELVRPKSHFCLILMLVIIIIIIIRRRRTQVIVIIIITTAT